MTETTSPVRTAAASRARAAAMRRAERPLFLGLMGVLLALWTGVLLAVGGTHPGTAGPGHALHKVSLLSDCPGAAHAAPPARRI